MQQMDSSGVLSLREAEAALQIPPQVTVDWVLSHSLPQHLTCQQHRSRPIASLAKLLVLCRGGSPVQSFQL